MHFRGFYFEVRRVRAPEAGCFILKAAPARTDADSQLRSASDASPAATMTGEKLTG